MLKPPCIYLKDRKHTGFCSMRLKINIAKEIFFFFLNTTLVAFSFRRSSSSANAILFFFLFPLHPPDLTEGQAVCWELQIKWCLGQPSVSVFTEPPSQGKDSCVDRRLQYGTQHPLRQQGNTMAPGAGGLPGGWLRLRGGQEAPGFLSPLLPSFLPLSFHHFIPCFEII